MIIEKAKIYCEEMNIDADVKYSEGWLLRNFKHRHGIRVMDVAGKKKSTDAEAAAAYSEVLEQVIQENNLTPDQVFNADETGFYCLCLPTLTFVGHDERRAAVFKANKERITFLCANAVGSCRCKLLVTERFEKPRAFKNLKTKLPVIYQAQGNAWMSQIFSRRFFFPTSSR